MVHLAHGHIIPFGGSTKKVKAKAKAANKKKAQEQGQNKNEEEDEDEDIPLLPLTMHKLNISFLLPKLFYPPFLRNIAFLIAAIFLGSKLIAMTNEDAYYAVMKRAPSIGTLWLWSILELPLFAALLGAVIPLSWAVFWKRYALF